MTAPAPDTRCFLVKTKNFPRLLCANLLPVAFLAASVLFRSVTTTVDSFCAPGYRFAPLHRNRYNYNYNSFYPPNNPRTMSTTNPALRSSTSVATASAGTGEPTPHESAKPSQVAPVVVPAVNVNVNVNDDGNNNNNNNNNPRTRILAVGASAGRLCGVGMGLPPDGTTLSARDAERLTSALSDLMADLCAAASSLPLELNWVRSIRAKMALNARKYPVEHCKGKAGKYTKYSHLTGVTTDNQSTADFGKNNDNGDNNSNDTTDGGGGAVVVQSVSVSLDDFAHHHLVELSHDIGVFAEERLWAKYHTPRNLILALLGEAGELAELLQWNGDVDNSDNNTTNTLALEATTLDKLSQELADVSIYAIRLATVCGVVDDLKQSLVERATVA